MLYYHPNDQIFTVYSAPTSAAYVEANGKAKVSTNDWILVYGKESDYYLIQYSINETAMRYGYIPSSSLAYLNMGEFIWANQEAIVKKKTNLRQHRTIDWETAVSKKEPAEASPSSFGEA